MMKIETIRRVIALLCLTKLFVLITLYHKVNALASFFRGTGEISASKGPALTRANARKPVARAYQVGTSCRSTIGSVYAYDRSTFSKGCLHLDRLRRSAEHNCPRNVSSIES